MLEHDNTQSTQFRNDSTECIRYEDALLRINAAYQRLHVHTRILQSEVIHLRSEDMQLRNEITILHNSRSWRLTKPLRVISRLIRNIINSL
jgi:hypothetical protein